MTTARSEILNKVFGDLANLENSKNAQWFRMSPDTDKEIGLLIIQLRNDLDELRKIFEVPQDWSISNSEAKNQLEEIKRIIAGKY